MTRDLWNKKRTERIDYLNETLNRKQHAAATFNDVDQAMREYFIVTGQTLGPIGPEPPLSDFYTPGEVLQTVELIFCGLIVRLSATGLLAYNLLY